VTRRRLNADPLQARLAQRSRKRCEATTRRGTPCPNFPSPGKTKCNFHSGMASAAGLRGGKRRARFNSDELPVIAPPQNVADVLRALGQVFSEVHDGRLEPKVGNACAYLASGILQAVTAGQFEERIVALEKRYEVMSPTR
jgi:hypothetical protein